MNIKFLKTTVANSAGEVTPVIMETEFEIYYYDGWERWSYLNKDEEGVVFEYTKEPPTYRIPENDS